jgi:hypothetical protein
MAATGDPRGAVNGPCLVQALTICTILVHKPGIMHHHGAKPAQSKGQKPVNSIS